MIKIKGNKKNYFEKGAKMKKKIVENSQKVKKQIIEICSKN